MTGKKPVRSSDEHYLTYRLSVGCSSCSKRVYYSIYSLFQISKRIIENSALAMEDRGTTNENKTGTSAPPWVSRVYIVDDHRFFTFALASLINTQADLVVCGVGHNEAEALSGIIGLSPDIVVLDVRLNAGDGLIMAAAVRRFSKQIPILFVSSMQHPSFGQEAKWLEPCSFVEKTQDPVDIIRGIQQALTKFRLFQSLHPTSITTPKT